MDAQRGDVFATVIDARSKATLEAAGRRESRGGPRSLAIAPRGPAVVFIGDAVTRDEALLDAGGNGRWQIRRPEPLAPQIAVLARRLAEQGKAGPPHALIPIYVRRSDAEIDRERSASTQGRIER